MPRALRYVIESIRHVEADDFLRTSTRKIPNPELQMRFGFTEEPRPANNLERACVKHRRGVLRSERLELTQYGPEPGTDLTDFQPGVVVYRRRQHVGLDHAAYYFVQTRPELREVLLRQ